MSVNKVILVGRLGKDPEIRHTDSGKKVATFSIATDDSYKNQQGEKVPVTDWHKVVFWGKIVGVIESYVKKGSHVYIEGKLKTRSYEQDGITKYVTEVLGNNLTMLGGKNQDQGSNNSQSTQIAGSTDWENEETDDLPF